MRILKLAILGAALLAAACQPAGAPTGKERIAAKIADAMLNEGVVVQVTRQQMQGLMSQNVIGQDQVNQVGAAVSRQLTTDLPEVKKTMVASLTKEFNIKELEFYLKMLTSKEGHAVAQKQEAAMQDTMTHMGKLAQEATTKAVARVNSAWPTGGHPAPPPQPGMDMQGLPEGMQQLPN